MGKKCPPQAFVGIPAGKFFRCGDGDGEPKPDGEFPVAIPTDPQLLRKEARVALPKPCFSRQTPVQELQSAE
jgi:hypothetical protein